MIRINQITKSFDATRALDNVSLTVGRSEVVSIIGYSGSGKSTLLNMLGGLDKPSAGSLFIDGKDIKGVTLESLRRNISPVLQDTFLFNGTIAENIGYAKRKYCIQNELFH